MAKSASVIIISLLFSLVVPAIGYISFGTIPAIIFLVGFLGGFIFWLFTSNKATYNSIKVIYWIVFGLFLLHRVEEKVCGFFAALAKLTDVPVPQISSWALIVLVLMSVGGWIVAPFLIKRGNGFGYFLAWTLFASTGVSELAHFIFPFYAYQSYGYFPGMWSVLILAPVSWYAMWKLSAKNKV